LLDVPNDAVRVHDEGLAVRYITGRTSKGYAQLGYIEGIPNVSFVLLHVYDGCHATIIAICGDWLSLDVKRSQ
jgi:hypothetical protein